MQKRLGKQTVQLSAPAVIMAQAAVVGKKEGEGPLKNCFDYISEDSYFGANTWEKAETAMLKRCFETLCDKASLAPNQLDYVLSGDLLNQCVSSSFAMRDMGIPYFGLYGACSTMAESLSLGAMLVDGGYADRLCAITGSHFCSAERQFRFPLSYGGQRTPTSQWTVTASGGVILQSGGSGPAVTHITTGTVIDGGIADANNMGAAMAPAAYDTLSAHFTETGRGPEYYDAIFTGDLGTVGHDILAELMKRDNIHLGVMYMDCGVLMFDENAQDVHAGGSGCGCSASVLAGHIIPAMRKGIWNRVLFAATGALMSPTTCQQGDTISGICHAVAIENM